jgi:cell division protein FtsB
MNKEICELCENYIADTECELQDTCKIHKAVKENETLKAENKSLKKQLSDLKCEKSYMIDPLSIGYRNEMGG